MKALRSPFVVVVAPSINKLLDPLGHPEAEKWFIERGGNTVLNVKPVRANGEPWEHDLISIQENKSGIWFQYPGIDTFELTSMDALPVKVTIVPYG